MSLLNFREQMKKDTKVLLNANEFAEIHTISGQEVSIVIDVDEFKQRKLKAAEGTYVGEKIILIGKQSIPKRPVEGRRFILDDEIYYVLTCDVEGEFYKIALGKNDS